jgi:hypothetical protein
VRPAIPVPGQAQQARMAADVAAARARPVVLRHARVVLAMTPASDTSVPNMARIYNYWLGERQGPLRR